MAGDWIKMECATPDKPEVLAITAEMGWDDPDYTVGKLFRVWRWFDQHTVNGNAAGVTELLIDRIAFAPGFARAMSQHGWLIIYESGIRLPNFERHCGKTAKGRAQTAKRVSDYKANAKGNAATVTNTDTIALPREEKRREEVNNKVVSDHVPESFAAFWEAWPSSCRKVDKAKCVKKWKLSKLDPVVDQILSHVGQMKSSKQWKDGFEPAPLTYLNGRRWEDGNESGSSLPNADIFAGLDK